MAINDKKAYKKQSVPCRITGVLGALFSIYAYRSKNLRNDNDISKVNIYSNYYLFNITRCPSRDTANISAISPPELAYKFNAAMIL
ncbi:hypothetical protein HMPREF3213_02360 [Heyndrickxia coagulans]|uniref:Uncharacterized protein n=1 Tax=Heyndrickxia coagulans TaxID=1398 RepID=A0A133KKZ3_HEYCO|nr:hypothetical protein HMPREF3213_02360 [Heyndrickxia coagulans]